MKKLLRTHMPKYIYNARRKQQIMKESKHRKNENMEVNNPQDRIFNMPEKQKKIVGTMQ